MDYRHGTDWNEKHPQNYSDLRQTYHETSDILRVVVVDIGVTRSRVIESERDFHKNKERVQELKVLWKNERLHSTINKYIETIDVNTITSYCFPNSQL